MLKSLSGIGETMESRIRVKFYYIERGLLKTYGSEKRHQRTPERLFVTMLRLWLKRLSGAGKRISDVDLAFRFGAKLPFQG